MCNYEVPVYSKTCCTFNIAQVEIFRKRNVFAQTEGSKKPPNLETVKSLYYSDKIAFPKARNFARISEGETRNMAKAYLGRL